MFYFIIIRKKRDRLTEIENSDKKVRDSSKIGKDLISKIIAL